MKKLLTILLILPCFIKAQTFDKLIDDKINTAIKTQIIYDTIGVEKTVLTSGAIIIDTLTAPVGTVKPYILRFVITGLTTATIKVCQIIWVTNTNGVYSSEATNLKSGAGWVLEYTKAGARVRCDGSGAKIIKYEYKRLNL